MVSKSYTLALYPEPPHDVEAYIHRSGQTETSGKTDVLVMLYHPKRANVTRTEKESGVKFVHLSALQPADVDKAAGRDVVEMTIRISGSIIVQMEDGVVQVYIQPAFITCTMFCQA